MVSGANEMSPPHREEVVMKTSTWFSQHRQPRQPVTPIPMWRHPPGHSIYTCYQSNMLVSWLSCSSLPLGFWNLLSRVLMSWFQSPGPTQWKGKHRLPQVSWPLHSWVWGAQINYNSLYVLCIHIWVGGSMNYLNSWGNQNPDLHSPPHLFLST